MRIHKVIPLDNLEEETRKGWEFVLIVEDESVESMQANKSRFVPPPLGGPVGYGTEWIVRKRVQALVTRMPDHASSDSSSQ
jgi:hypothetical protein